MKAEIKLVKLGENMNGEGLIVCNEEVIFSWKTLESLRVSCESSSCTLLLWLLSVDSYCPNYSLFLASGILPSVIMKEQKWECQPQLLKWADTVTQCQNISYLTW